MNRKILKCIARFLIYMIVMFAAGKLITGCILVILSGQYIALCLAFLVLCFYSVFSILREVLNMGITVYTDGGFKS